MKIKRWLSVLVALALVLTCTYASVSAENTNAVEQKVYSTATINDSFAEDRVLVVLSNAKSLSFDSYDAGDFAEIDCKSVDNLTEEMGNYVAEKMGILDSGSATIFGHTSQEEEIRNLVETYNQVLCIELEDVGKENVLEAISILQERDDVLYAGPDYVISLCSTSSNDPYLADQWAVEKIQLPDAWDISTGSASVVVGVMDSGIDGSHPDLSGRIKTSLCRDYTSGNSVVVTTPTDPLGHGTHVAGIIGARGNNSVGISGVCWNVQLVSLRVLDETGFGYSSNAAQAINFATAQGIPVLNFSGRWVNSATYGYDYALNTVIANYPGLFVCASGNDHNNNDTTPVYPAAYNLPNLITVGAVYKNGHKCTFSNYGKTTVDLFSPGSDILSCVPTSLCVNGTCDEDTHYANGYHSYDGTSMAAPYVAGIAALILSIHPEMTASELKQVIMDSVDLEYNNSSGNSILSGYCVTGGTVNAYKALSNADVHNYRFTNNGLLNGHTCTCMTCNYSYAEGHTWTESASNYKCSKCLLISDFIPVTPANIPQDILVAIQEDGHTGDYSISINGDTELCCIDGQYYLVKGYTGSSAVQYIQNNLHVRK